MVNHTEIVDYAKPTIEAEKNLRLMHEAMLNKDYQVAQHYGVEAIVSTKIALNSIKIAEEDATHGKGTRVELL